ncbi:hypothetical protein L202_06588 [Cryptococcus amylolentus CBS 6039]|uniref:Uncharacterized protein n=2 Tax=Cryptococcus amylolentus TaxID=104669 RepID=A0A1E3HGH6_9TREE|nr:hypothetical protein L202_06588 [Cryptococcus amylolentus CBS 6039]ODN75442.1 hypothetical protein L202_06588 [Cryptococcus amylolentus CBS 6039]ODO03170.1 hypothetical protein I350_06015 [Cryptococcus amylolentus CBS 6273]
MQPSQGPHQLPASSPIPSSLAKRTTGVASTSAAPLNPSLHNTHAAAKACRALNATESKTPAAGPSLRDKGKEREDTNTDSIAQATPVPPSSDSTAQAALVPPSSGSTAQAAPVVVIRPALGGQLKVSPSVFVG